MRRACWRPNHPAPEFPRCGSVRAHPFPWIRWPDCNWLEFLSRVHGNRRKSRCARGESILSTRRPPSASCPRPMAPSTAILFLWPGNRAQSLVSGASPASTVARAAWSTFCRRQGQWRSSQNRNARSASAPAPAPSLFRRALPCRTRRPQPSGPPRRLFAAPASNPFPCTTRNLPWPCSSFGVRQLSCRFYGVSVDSQFKFLSAAKSQKREQSSRAPHTASYVPSLRLTMRLSCGNLCTKRKSSDSLGAFRRFLFAAICYPLTPPREFAGSSLATGRRPLAHFPSRLHHPRSHPHNRVLRRPLIRLRCHARQLLLHHVRKLAHLPLHLDHLFSHVQDDLDACQVHAHVPRQRQDHVQPLKVRIRIQRRVAQRPRRLQQSHAFVQTQRLRMQLINLRDGADHVPGFGAFSGLWRHGLHTPALANKSLRGSAGATSSSSFIRLRTRSSVGSGTTTWISTYWSPRSPLRALGTPFSFSRSVLPLFVPGGMRTSERPSIVGTSTFAPSDASDTVTGTFVYKSFPRRSKNSCGRTTTRRYKSPAGAPIVPALPLPGTRTRPPLATPAGMRTSIVSVRRTRPSPPQFLQAVRNFPVPPQRLQGTLNRILPAAC